jgi:hypothetical protein
VAPLAAADRMYLIVNNRHQQQAQGLHMITLDLLAKGLVRTLKWKRKGVPVPDMHCGG